MLKISHYVVVTALSVILGLAGCQKKDDASAKNFDADRYFSVLKKDVFIDPGGTSLDIETVIAALPSKTTVKYDGANFDKKSGATTFEDVTFSMSAYPEVGLKAETLSIWGGDSVAMVQLVSGQNFDASAPLASRIEATDLSMFGLETMFDPLMEATNALTEDIVKDMSGLQNGELKQDINDYKFSIGKFVMTDFTVHPSVLELTPSPFKPGETESAVSNAAADKLWQYFQKMGHYSAMFSSSDVAIYDTEFGLNFTQGKESVDMTGMIELYGYTGYRQGDLDYLITKNMSYDMDMSIVPEGESDDGPAHDIKMSGFYERSVAQNVRLAKAMEYLARGVMPDRSDTDFMGFGTWKGENSSVSLNGTPFYSVGYYSADMSKFHWLVPEIMEFRVDNVAYNVAGLMAYLENTLGDLNPALIDDPEEMKKQAEMMAEIVKILEKYDMSEPSLDLNFKASWDAETGETGFGYGAGVDNFLRYSLKGEGTLPNYEAVMNILPKKMSDVDKAELEALVKDALTVESFTIRVKDEGGFEKGFAMAKDFAELAPEGSREVAFLRSNSSEQLRMMMSSSLLLAAGPVYKAFPPAIDYLESASKFIQDGGELMMSMAPPNPLNAELVDSIETLVKTDPDKTVETLGLSVVHTPPK